MAHSTRELTAAIASGDSEAFARFYEAWFDEMYSYARAATGRDESFCLDVVQDVMVKVIRRIPTLDAEAALRCWLRRAVLTTARDAIRGERRRMAREARTASGVAAASEREADEELLGRVREGIREMNEELSELIIARHRFGWTLARIACAFGVTPGAADGRIRRGMASLRRRAGEEAVDDA